MSYTAWVIWIVVLVVVVAAPRYGVDSREPSGARFGDRDRRTSLHRSVADDIRAVLGWTRRLGRPAECVRGPVPTGRG